MNILIVNLHSSLNAGDDVLTRVSIDLLHRNFPNAHIKLAMNDPDSFADSKVAIGSFVTWVKPQGTFGKGSISGFLALGFSFFAAIVYRLVRIPIFKILPKRFHPLLNAYTEADLIVSSAGNFFYSSGRFSFAFLISIAVILFAVILKKPLYTMPQTLGPLNHRWENWLLGWTVRKIRLFFVRDPISMRLLQQVQSWHEGCHLVPDIAFLFTGDSDAGEKILLDIASIPPHTPKLGVTLINWQAQNHRFHRQDVYETAVAVAIRTFIKETAGQVVLFSQVRGPSIAEDDRIPAQRVYAMLPDLRQHILLIEEENVTPDTLKAAYSLMDIFIGTRLHSNIFALTSGIPAIMLQYQYKTRGVVEMLGLEKWVIDINEVTDSHLSTQLMSLWAQRQAVKKEVQHAVTETTDQIEHIGTMIATDYKTFS